MKECVEKQMEDIKEKLKQIEYQEIKEIKEDIADLKCDFAKNNVIVEENTRTMRELSDTMTSVRETMVSISSAVECLGSSNKEVVRNLRQQNEKIDDLQARQNLYDKKATLLEEKIHEQNEKSKFDILLFFKSNFVKILLIAGAIVYFKYFNN